jgi:MFS-type transporter involved in bile tolerance (Atg22 family)
MVIVDGIDGYNASGVQFSGADQNRRGLQTSRILNILVVVSSFALAVAAFANCRLEAVAFPLGAALFASVFLLRVWHRQ